MKKQENGEFKIEKGIPIPRSITKYSALPKLEIGESFFVPAEDGQSLREAASQVKRRYKDRNFTIRKQSGGYRCWRIALTD